MEISNVLTQLLYEGRISEAALGRKIKVPRATINRIVSGKTPDPRASTLNAIAEYFNVTIDQLLGKQPIFNKTSESSLLATMRTSIPIIEWTQANSWETITSNLTPNSHPDWILSEPELEGGKFSLRVKGDSMWPLFQEKTLLIIDPAKEPKNRDYVIVHLHKDNEILFRQLTIEGKYKFIKSINEIFPTLQLDPFDKIIGVVIQTRSNLG